MSATTIQHPTLVGAIRSEPSGARPARRPVAHRNALGGVVAVAAVLGLLLAMAPGLAHVPASDVSPRPVAAPPNIVQGS